MFVNGKNKEFEGYLVNKMLEELGLNKDKVVIELNLEILPKEQYDKTTLREEDKVEIVAFVGGG